MAQIRRLTDCLRSTGYTYIRETNAELLGEDVINKTEDVYGIDQEGELRGSYRPCGYPGVGPTQQGFSSAFELSFIATVVVRDGGPLQLSFPIETSSKHLPPLLWVHFH